MFKTETINEKIRLILLVMCPILVTRLALYSMNFIDTTMSGRAEANDLAGVAIGSSLWVPILTGITGFLLEHQFLAYTRLIQSCNNPATHHVFK